MYFRYLVSRQSKGLFHKAISMSGYTTSISPKNMHISKKKSSTSSHTSNEIVKKIINNNLNKKKFILMKEIRDILLNSYQHKDFLNIMLTERLMKKCLYFI